VGSNGGGSEDKGEEAKHAVSQGNFPQGSLNETLQQVSKQSAAVINPTYVAS